jgi:hypothetical protein
LTYFVYIPISFIYAVTVRLTEIQDVQLAESTFSKLVFHGLRFGALDLYVKLAFQSNSRILIRTAVKSDNPFGWYSYLVTGWTTGIGILFTTGLRDFLFFFQTWRATLKSTLPPMK